MTDIKTGVAHPESSCPIERVRRTHREEGLVGEELPGYYQALHTMSAWAGYYNKERPALGTTLPVPGRLRPARSAGLQ